MQDIAIIFLYTEYNKITKLNLENLKKFNPGVPLYAVNKNDLTKYHYDFFGKEPIHKWSVWDLWYKCDNIFFYWYLSFNIRAKNYILVEWDTLCLDISFKNFFGDQQIKNEGMMSCLLKNIKDLPNDDWFHGNNYRLLKRFFSRESIYKFSPMSCSVISNECVKGCIDHIKKNPEINNIYVETKLTTISKHLGFPVNEYQQMHPIPFSQYINYHEKMCERTINFLKYNDNMRGIFHPVKQEFIYAKYIDDYTLELNKDIKIHKIIYGSCIDITEQAQNILNNQNIIVANNNIAGDPCPNKTKELTIIYEQDSKLLSVTIPEHKKIKIV
jgi:hypothetical protein